MERGPDLALPDGFEARAIGDGGGRLLVLGGPKGTSPLDKPPRRVSSLALDGTDARLVVEDSFGDMLAASGGFVAWASPHAVAIRAIEGNEPIAPADAKMTCAPAVSGGFCFFVAPPAMVPDAAAGGSPVARLDARTGQIRVLCTIASEVGGLAASAGSVLVAEPAARAVHVVPIDGGVPQMLVRGEEHVGPIAASGDTLYAVVDRAVLAVPIAGGDPRAVVSAHDAFRHAKKLVVGVDALYVVTRAYALATGTAVGAALHRVARTGHSVETVLALPPPPGIDFLSMLRADTLDDVAVVGEDVFVLTRSRGRAAITRLPRPVREEPEVPEPSIDPVRDAYEAHLGPRDPLEPTVRRLVARGWTGAIVQGRTAGHLWYTATSGLRGGRAGYDVAVIHRKREAWAPELVAMLAEIELTRGQDDGAILELLAQHGGVTAGPFSVGRRKVGVLLVDGPPLLPWSVDVGGRPVRLLRAVTLTLAELQHAAECGVAALIPKLAEVLAASVSDPRRASVV